MIAKYFKEIQNWICVNKRSSYLFFFKIQNSTKHGIKMACIHGTMYETSRLVLQKWVF